MTDPREAKMSFGVIRSAGVRFRCCMHHNVASIIHIYTYKDPGAEASDVSLAISLATDHGLKSLSVTLNQYVLFDMDTLLPS